MLDKFIKIYAIIVSISMLALIVSVAMPRASAAPVTTLSISEPKYGTSPIYVNSFTEFTLTASESVDIWYKWGMNNYTKYTAPFTAVVVIGSSGGAPGLPVDLEGLQTLYYNATGEAQRSAQVYVDDYYPVTSIHFSGTHYAGEYEFIESSTLISFTSSDTGSSVQGIVYAINNGPETPYTSPFTVSGFGLQSIYYYSIDNLGNQEIMKQTTVSVDNDAPVIQILPGEPKFTDASSTVWVSSGTSISISFSDTSGISSSSYKKDSGPWTLYTGPFTFSSEGTHTIAARATDNLGHASEEVTLVLRVDSTPPAVSVIGAVSGKLNAEFGESVSIQATDLGSGNPVIYYSLTGAAPWSIYTSPIPIVNSTNITYYAADALGNEASVSTVQVLVGGSGDADDGAVPWRLYLGIALIAGGILLLLFVILQSKPSSLEKDHHDPGGHKKSNNHDNFEEKPKRKRRNY